MHRSKLFAPHAIHFVTVTIAALCLYLTAGCSEESPVQSNGGPASYLPEYDPTVSFDGNTVYLAAFDSVGDRGGVYAASLVDPVRERVLAGDSLFSPTVSPDESTLACLSGDSLMIVGVSNGLVDTVLTDLNLNSVCFINDTLLVVTQIESAPYIGAISLLNARDWRLTPFAEGYDAGRYNRDTVIYMSRVYGSAAAIVRKAINALASDTIQWAYDLQPSESAHWPSVNRALGRLAYTHWRNYATMVKATIVADTAPWPPAHMLTASTTTKSLMIGHDRILYGGADGRLWESNYAGTIQQPFWAKLESN